MSAAATPATWSLTGPPSEAELPAASMAAIERIRAQGVPATELHRWLGHAPDALTAWIGFAAPLRSSEALTPAIRELVILRVAHTLGSARTVRHHVTLAREAGSSQEQLRALHGPIPSELFGPAELDALAIVDLVLEHRPVSAAALHVDGLSPGEVVHAVVLTVHYAALIALLKGFELQ